MSTQGKFAPITNPNMDPPKISHTQDLDEIRPEHESFLCGILFHLQIHERHNRISQKKMEEFQLRKMSTEDIEKFFEPENIQQIAKYVYLKDETSKEERRKIRNSKEKFFIYFTGTE